jgi:hypothetical protein
LKRREFGRARHRRDDNIKMDMKETGCEVVDWTEVADNDVR